MNKVVKVGLSVLAIIVLGRVVYLSTRAYRALGMRRIFKPDAGDSSDPWEGYEYVE